MLMTWHTVLGDSLPSSMHSIPVHKISKTHQSLPLYITERCQTRNTKQSGGTALAKAGRLW